MPLTRTRTRTARAAAALLATATLTAALTSVTAPANAGAGNGTNNDSSSIKVSYTVTTQLAQAIESAHADGVYPTTEAGTTYAEQTAATLTTKDVETYYWAKADQSEFCVSATVAGELDKNPHAKFWVYSSDLAKPTKTNFSTVLKGKLPGVCGTAFTETLEAQARQAATAAIAKQYATTSYSIATVGGGSFPSKGKLLKLTGPVGKDYQLTKYRIVRATKNTPAYFQLCVTHKAGAWTSYDGSLGGIVAGGTTGKLCNFPAAV